MITNAARTLLSRFDSLTPADGDELCLLSKERGWVEALMHLADLGLLTPEGEVEAMKILAASGEWADGFQGDIVLPPVPEETCERPTVVGGPGEG